MLEIGKRMRIGSIERLKGARADLQFGGLIATQSLNDVGRMSLQVTLGGQSKKCSFATTTLVNDLKMDLHRRSSGRGMVEISEKADFIESD